MNDLDATQRRLTLTRLPLGAFVLTAACIGLSIGIVIGVVGLAVSATGVLDFRLTERLGGHELRGIQAGLFGIIVFPIYFMVVIGVLAVPAYLPFRLVWRVIGGIKVPASSLAEVPPREDHHGSEQGSVQPVAQPDAEEGAG